MSKRVLGGMRTPKVDIVAQRAVAVGEEITLEHEQAKFPDGLAPIEHLLPTTSRAKQSPLFSCI